MIILVDNGCSARDSGGSSRQARRLLVIDAIVSTKLPGRSWPSSSAGDEHEE